MPGGAIRAVIKNHCYSTRYWLLSSSCGGCRYPYYYDLLKGINLFSLHHSVCKWIVCFTQDRPLDENICVWSSTQTWSINWLVKGYLKLDFTQKLWDFCRRLYWHHKDLLHVISVYNLCLLPICSGKGRLLWLSYRTQQQWVVSAGTKVQMLWTLLQRVSVFVWWESKEAWWSWIVLKSWSTDTWISCLTVSVFGRILKG